MLSEGCIRSYGISTNSLDVLKRFNANGTCSVVQVDYSLLNRAPEDAFLPYCQENGIAVMVRGPLAKGLLSGRYTKGSIFTDTVAPLDGPTIPPQHAKYEQQIEQVERLAQVVRPGAEMVNAAIAYTFSHPAVSVTIPGAKSAEQARMNAAAGQKVLTSEELAALASA
ncbi:MAG: aldo/keto reductase [Caldilineaceae bacterium]